MTNKMIGKYVEKLISGAKYFRTERNGALHFNSMVYRTSDESHDDDLLSSSEWCEKAFLKISKLSRLLKDVDLIDGSLIDIRDDSIIVNDRVEQKMRTFKSLARVLVGSYSSQQTLKKYMVSCFSKPSERESVTVSSLAQVGKFLNIAKQQRKSSRTTICPLVTQHHIWMGALEEVLNELKPQLEYLNCRSPTKGTHMSCQIISNCLKLFHDTAISSDEGSISWMRLVPRKAARSSGSHTWKDVLDMFDDLIECLKSEDMLLHYTVKLEYMKEGLFHIKDVLIDKSIGYKEAQYQENLVAKILSQHLGYPSQCLFTLLLYYLYGHVRYIEIDLCGRMYRNGRGRFMLCMGRVVTSDEEKMVMSGVKQLDRALRLFKFAWETAGMKGELDLQGHLWCVGAHRKLFTYNGKRFFIHEISV